MALNEVIDEHFLMRYRLLLDAESAAFDDLEHAFEEGDRERWKADLDEWQEAVSRKLAYLARLGLDPRAVSTPA